MTNYSSWVHPTPRRSHSGNRRRPTAWRRQRSVSPTRRGSSSRPRRSDLDADEKRVARERREREAEAGRQQTTSRGCSALDRIILTRDRIHTPTLMLRRLRLRHTKPTNNDQRRRSSSLFLFRPFPPTLPHWHLIRAGAAHWSTSPVSLSCTSTSTTSSGRGLCQPPTCPRTSPSQLPVRSTTQAIRRHRCASPPPSRRRVRERPVSYGGPSTSSLGLTAHAEWYGGYQAPARASERGGIGELRTRTDKQRQRVLVRAYARARRTFSPPQHPPPPPPREQI
ncbi:hypothetical protein C8F01DRAFT_161334 [Mycena amicta]|nr:hypothetical protein C8F01DRAFT_161334 [Mycena amicta]